MIPINVLEGVIIGGGISGLSLAHWLGLDANPAGWELWEATGRLGGTIGTDRVEGYSVDWGPNGFLDREPLTLRLAREVGLGEALEPADEKSEKRFIAKNGTLHPVPLSPPAILTTGLLGPLEKLRIFCEPFVPSRRDEADESVFDFAARRIGRGAAETFVDPMVSGIFGGVARELSLQACFPVMREMEDRHGGLVRAMIARRLESAKAAGPVSGPKKRGGPAGPAGWLTSFRGGLDVLVSRLAERLTGIVRLGRPVSEMARREGAWEIVTEGGASVRARRVVLTCPSFAAASVVRDFDGELASAFDSIPYAPIVVVASGHARRHVAHPLDGFGFLVPRSQGLRTLGSIWTSSIFVDRAPADAVQFRTMLGGAGDPSVLELSDGQLWETVRRDIGDMVGIKAEPHFLRIYRWQRGIPQFTLGHCERRSRLERLAARHEGLYMAGNAYYGVGLNDCVKMAHRIAREIRWS